MSLLLLVAAVVLFVWSACVSAGWMTFGTYGVLLGFGLACLAASLIPWKSYWR